MKYQRRKPAHTRHIKITITCSPVLYEAGKRIWEPLGFGPAGYFQAKIRKDAKLEPEPA